MGLKSIFSRSSVAKYARGIREAPRSVICNTTLLSSALLYALGGLAMTWEQGASAVTPSLRGFQEQFGIKSGSDASSIQTYVSIIYIGYAIGAALSFLINDYIGRRWAYRLYSTVFIIGQMTACFSPNVKALIGARIVSGLGIGSLSVIGPMAIVEIAPQEIRGLLTSWYTVSMGVALTTANFCVLGIYKNVPTGKLQYQIPLIAISVFVFLCIVASFFVSESPRWLMLVGRREEATEALTRLRRLPADHPRISSELSSIQASIISAAGDVEGNNNFLAIVKETFTVSSNLRRLNSANSMTTYFIPIMKMLRNGSDIDKSEDIFLSGMYGFSKLWFSLIASFFFIDVLGRRRSLFIGIAVQMVSHIYIGVFIKYNQEGTVSVAASRGAIAALFVHAFGYAVGLFILPYVFGGELWPNRIRSFGGAVGQTFHWLFIYAIKFSVPDLLKATDNWGAFLFFAGWCFVGLIYVYLMVPEVAGLSVEEIDEVFEGSWLNALKTTRRPRSVEGQPDGQSDTGKGSSENEKV
ncbi:general substrate transporter [Plectosphaerella plurivora]|uniref:General substrate transporter n=1 Tax=Plectosphaerella plurivora TaxID=936078 RepID=A0A9P9AF74_9PEZI|nr:general substrate transporter [Plectosphaerella plurivora]